MIMVHVTMFRENIFGGSSSEVIWVELRNKKEMITMLGLHNKYIASVMSSYVGRL